MPKPDRIVRQARFEDADWISLLGRWMNSARRLQEFRVNLSGPGKLQTSAGEPLVFFCGMVVAQTMPFGSADDVRADVEYAVDATDGSKGLFLFPANVINPAAPVENIRAAYAHAKTYSTGYATPPDQRRTQWPWALRDA